MEQKTVAFDEYQDEMITAIQTALRPGCKVELHYGDESLTVSVPRVLQHKIGTDGQLQQGGHFQLGITIAYPAITVGVKTSTSANEFMVNALSLKKIVDVSSEEHAILWKRDESVQPDAPKNIGSAKAEDAIPTESAADSADGKPDPSPASAEAGKDEDKPIAT